MSPIFIAEVKTKSPYNFQSKYSFEFLLELAIQNGDYISIHTNPLFNGNFENIHRARKQTSKPILAKGFHDNDDDIKKAIDFGADYVLVVDRFTKLLDSDLRNKLFLEFSNDSFISRLTEKDKKELKFVYNGRNLKTGIAKKYIGDYDKYRENVNWLCGASLLRDRFDVQLFYPKCDAFIVGENLLNFIQNESKLDRKS